MGEKLYALIIEDRHTDVEVRLFKSRTNAIKAAREYLTEEAERQGKSFDDYYSDDDHYPPYCVTLGLPPGWHLMAQYSSENDYLSVRGGVSIED